jgi:hypothetical protein
MKDNLFLLRILPFPVKTIWESSKILVMQNPKNVCSFCNSQIVEGQSICKDCIELYEIKIGNHEKDGCGCDT